MIPRRLIRTVPAETTTEVGWFWRIAGELHPDWDLVDLRDPIDPAEFSLTSPHWDRCTSGAQRAGLIRLEALWRWGGIYIDSDVELYRPLDGLPGLDVFAVFATFESPGVLNDAVLGAASGHPLIRRCIDEAIARLPEGALRSGPAVVGDLFRVEPAALVLPPICFSPYLWNERHRRHEDHSTNPATFGAHHWHNSHGA